MTMIKPSGISRALRTTVVLALVAALGGAASTALAAGARQRQAILLLNAVTLPPPPSLQPDPPSPVPPPASPCVTTKRALLDRKDVKEGPLVHVILMVAADAGSETLDIDGTLDCSIKAQNEWFRAQTGGLEWRFDTFMVRARKGTPAQEAVDVTYVQSALPGTQLGNADAVSRELRAKGFSDGDKRYLTYVAGGQDLPACGDAYYPYVPGETAVDGKFAQVYLDSPEGCRARQFGQPGMASMSETIAQQELIHNDGIVPVGAPHTCAVTPPFAHVCTGPLAVTASDPERFDVMFPYAGIALAEKKVDLGHDDYFKHPFPLRDLQVSAYLQRAGS